MSHPAPLVLASGSATRKALLENAAVPAEPFPARIDEESLRLAMSAEGISPRDMANHLAEAKAQKVSGKLPGRLVLGCDQVLEHRGEALGKVYGSAELHRQICRLRADRHILWSAAVLYRDGKPLWRHIGEARLEMADLTDTYIEGYIARNGKALEATVGGYMVEGEGIRLFSRIDGDHFTVLGLPLLLLLRQLARMGEIDT